jgi:hypothetical protein
MKDFIKIDESTFNIIKLKLNTSGWCNDFNRAYSNSEYVALVRTINTKWGKVRHSAIRSYQNEDIPWSIKQEIKDKIFGKEKTAIEVFPSDKNLVNQANMYHLWVLPKEFDLQFNLKE